MRAKAHWWATCFICWATSTSAPCTSTSRNQRRQERLPSPMLGSWMKPGRRGTGTLWAWNSRWTDKHGWKGKFTVVVLPQAHARETLLCIANAYQSSVTSCCVLLVDNISWVTHLIQLLVLLVAVIITPHDNILHLIWTKMACSQIFPSLVHNFTTVNCFMTNGKH